MAIPIYGARATTIFALVAAMFMLAPAPSDAAFGLVSSSGAGGVAIDVDAAGNEVAIDGYSGGGITIYDISGHQVSHFDASLSDPRDIAFDHSGDIWVADTGNNRLVKFSREGAQLATIGTAGTAAGQFQSPAALAIDGAGAIYVVDRANNRVQKFSAAGVVLAVWSSVASGAQLSHPAGIAVAPSGESYVADIGNGTIEEFTPGGSFVRAFGSFRLPDGVPLDGGTLPLALGDDGTLYMLNVSGIFYPYHGVERFSSTGTAQTGFGCTGGSALAASGNSVYIAGPQIISGGHGGITPAFLDRFGDPGAPMPCKPLEVSAASRQSARRLRVTLACPEQACNLTVTGSIHIKGKRKAIKLKRTTVSLEADVPQVVRLSVAHRRQLDDIAALSRSVRRKSEVDFEAVAAPDAVNQAGHQAASSSLR